MAYETRVDLVCESNNLNGNTDDTYGDADVEVENRHEDDRDD